MGADMKRIVAVSVFSLSSLCGCYSPLKECGVSDQEGWEQLSKPPDNRAILIEAALKDERFKDPDFLGNREYWFKTGEGSFLLCRRMPEVPYGRCFSDGWVFHFDGQEWKSDRGWGEICTG